jgi:hypothetical protein
LIAVLGMVALAIDIGMVAVAKTQAQNAADSAATAGARSLNQQAGFNLSGATVAAVTAATQNKIFNANIPGDPTQITNPTADTYVSGQVTIECGGYYYVYNDANPAAEAFGIVIPGKSATEPYTAIRATINSTSPVFFGAVFGSSAFNVVAHAVAAHRPRDVVIIMDLSGSMRFQSCPGGYYDGTNLTPQSGPRNKSLNPDTNYPTPVRQYLVHDRRGNGGPGQHRGHQQFRSALRRRHHVKRLVHGLHRDGGQPGHDAGRRQLHQGGRQLRQDRQRHRGRQSEHHQPGRVVPQRL